jgi:1-acyl-sn-glycerol-3-phosphate acyltransferase
MERTGLSGALVGLQARFVDWLIGRSLRKHFRAVYVRFAAPEVVDSPPSLRFPPLREGNRAGSGETPLREGNREGRTRSVPPAGRGNLEKGVGIGGLSELGCPVILFANHHYWWDGYLGYWLIRAWGRRMVVWMESYRRFPPFGAIGALPFPPDDPMARARTVKRSVQALRTEPATALLLFPEGTLHGDTERLLPFQRSLHWLACRAPQATLLPLAIHIEPSYHQYPRAYLSVGAPFQSAATEPTDWLAEAAGAVETLLRQTRIDARAALTDEQHAARGFQVLLQGALSIHERF